MVGELSSLYLKERAKAPYSFYTIIWSLSALPKEYGQWSTIYKRFRRWSENGVLDRVFTALNEERLKNADVSVLSLDST